MQRHLSYYVFSLTTIINLVSQNARVTAAAPQTGDFIRGMRVYYYFASGCLSIPFRPQSVATLKKGDQWQIWEFIRI